MGMALGCMNLFNDELFLSGQVLAWIEIPGGVCGVVVVVVCVCVWGG